MAIHRILEDLEQSTHGGMMLAKLSSRMNAALLLRAVACLIFNLFFIYPSPLGFCPTKEHGFNAMIGWDPLLPIVPQIR